MKEGGFAPFLNVDAGEYNSKDYPIDGQTGDVNGGFGIRLGRGSLALFGEYLHRDKTNRAWPDIFLADANGVTDVIDTLTGRILQKRNSLTQPNYHWGDGVEADAMSFANFRLPLNPGGTSELYAFGGYSHRSGTGNGFWRYFDSERNWPEIYPQGFLPEFHPDVRDYSGVAGFRAIVSGWSLDAGGSFGGNRFDYNLRNTLNASLGPCLGVPCAPGPDSLLGTPDDPGIPNQLSFFAGRLERTEAIGAINVAKPVQLGLSAPVNVALGVAVRRESFKITAGERASWIDGGHLAQDSATGGGRAPAGSSVFPGFAPSDASDHSRSNIGAYVDLESQLTPKFLANVAGRFEHYSDFGQRLSGKLALRFQPTPRFVVRGAASTGFRAPGLAQSFFSHTTTNVIGGQFVEVGNFPVDNHASRIFGAKPLKDETAVNLSAGFAFTPRDNVTFTVDVFRIQIKDRVLLGATFGDTVSQRILSDSGFSSIGAVQFFTNGLDTRTRGIDITGGVNVPAGAGTLDLSAAVNYTTNKITRVDPLPAILQGTATDLTSILDLVTTVGIEEERPNWRGTLTAQYTVVRFHALGRLSYYGGFASAQPSFTDRETYGAKTLADVELGYQFSDVNLVPRPSSTTTTTRSRGPRRRRSAITAAMCTRAPKCGSTSDTLLGGGFYGEPCKPSHAPLRPRRPGVRGAEGGAGPERSDQRYGARRQRNRVGGRRRSCDEPEDGAFESRHIGRRWRLHHFRPRRGSLYGLWLDARPTHGIPERSSDGGCDGLAGLGDATSDLGSDHRDRDAARAGVGEGALLHRCSDGASAAAARGGEHRSDRRERRWIQRAEPGTRPKSGRHARRVLGSDRPGPTRRQGRSGCLSGRCARFALAVHAGSGPV